MLVAARQRILIVAVLLGATVLEGTLVSSVYAPSCVELASCSIDLNHPLDFFLIPLHNSMGDWIYIILWGLIIGPIYMRTGHPLLAGMIGVLISASLLENTTTGSTLPDAFLWGALLMIASLGLVSYHVFRRANAPSV